MRRRNLALIVALALAACGDQPTAFAPVPPPLFAPGQTGTGIAMPLLIVSVCQSGGQLTVSGSMTVTNDGAVATEGLVLAPRVQYKAGKGPFQDLAGAAQTITPAQQVAAGASQSFAFSITFTPVAGAIYRLAAPATITNHPASPGTPKGPEAKLGFGGGTIPACSGGAVNTPPQAIITSPASGTQFFHGVQVTVNGNASDTEDGDLSANIAWSSDIAGALGTGAGFSTTGLTVGTHTITAAVSDSDGAAAQASITIIIKPVGNATPTVNITAPANGSTFTAGAAVAFTGTASDPEDGNLTASIAWNSSIDGSLGTGGSVNSSALSAGTHTITAGVTDALGASGSATISITIDPASTSCGGTFTGLAQIFSDATVQAFANFEVIDGNVFVQANDVLVDVEFPCLKTVTGVLGVTNNRAMVDIAFPALVEVGLVLNVSVNPILTSASFPLLRQVGQLGSTSSASGGALLVSTNPALTNLDIGPVTIRRNVVPSQLGGLQIMQPLGLTTLSGLSTAIAVDSMFFTLPAAGQPGLTQAQFQAYKNSAPLVLAVCELPFGPGGARVCL